jgi:hypothetical protein
MNPIAFSIIPQLPFLDQLNNAANVPKAPF